MRGTHGRSGPPPDPTALRRERKTDAGWITLPAEGRRGDPPPFPLAGATARERHWWAYLWAMPQAVQWERDGQFLEVAIYTRRLTEAEKRGASTALGTLVRQLSEQLGLTIPGMHRLRWKIAGNELAERRAERTAEDAGPSARDRFRVVDATG